MGSRFRSDFRSNEAAWLAHARRSKRSDRSPTARPDFPRSVIAAAPRLQGRRRGALFHRLCPAAETPARVANRSVHTVPDGRSDLPEWLRCPEKGQSSLPKNGPTEDVAREKCRHGSNGDVSPVEFERRYVQRGSGVSMGRRGIQLQIGDRIDSRSSALRSSCAMGSSAPSGVRVPSIERIGRWASNQADRMQLCFSRTIWRSPMVNSAESKSRGISAIFWTILLGSTFSVAFAQEPAWPAKTHYRYHEVEGKKIFFREAGDPSKPTIVLLHGFPSSSHTYRELIPLLSGTLHVIAPDYIGSGYSDRLDPDQTTYTFDLLAKYVSGLIAGQGIERYTLYMQDFGSPVGYRVMLQQPRRLDALIVQNANA